MTVAADWNSDGSSQTVQAFNLIRRISFPSTPEVISIFTITIMFSTISSLPWTGMRPLAAIWVAFSLVVLPSVFGEIVVSTLFLRSDKVLNFRRLMGMEMLSWWSLVLVLPLSILLGKAFSGLSLWAFGFLFSLAFSVPLRTLSVFSMSSLSSARKLVASGVVPMFSVGAFIESGSLGLPSHGQALSGILLISVELLLSAIWVSRLIGMVESSGVAQIGSSPMSLFRAFLQHWLEKDPKPLEHRLASLGSKSKIETSILGFEADSQARKSCVVVSNYHPGPYRDLGSGGLPSSLKFSLESSRHTLALVPHGISSHANNIILDQDIERLLAAANQNYPIVYESGEASRLVRANVEGAQASAQAFGDVVFVTLTLAPEDMEDLPEEVSAAVRAAARAHGLKEVTADSHNSLSRQTSITTEQARRLTEAATKALNLVSEIPKGPFRVGVAFDPLDEFTLEDGVGPGGLSVLAVEAMGLSVAYLVIDGNNMHPSFRGLILDVLKRAGFADAEVMTTDTHLVTGLVRSRLGYHPVGENANESILIRRITDTVSRAQKNMGLGRAGFSRFELELRVLGSGTFQSTVSFVSSISRTIGRSLFKLELATLVAASLILGLVM